jgi:catechol 2,3-dioxygenase-like lactoylglutathione lyase family enzyme
MERGAMSLMPIVRCNRLAVSLRFYEDLLEFRRVDGGESIGDPGFCMLARGDDVLFLSSYAGDGVFGQAISVPVSDVDRLFAELRTRGLKIPEGRGSPVHEAPVDQTWGTREFYVDDPDGNTIRFIQGLRLPG